MFESLAWGFVIGYLGKYVVGLKKEELKLSWWNGLISLQNVELNTKTLEEEFPIGVRRGFVRNLVVKIPWNRLLTQSVEIEVNGVNVKKAISFFFGK